MRQRIKPQYKTVTRNAIGEEVVTWNDLVTTTTDHAIWAEVWPLKGREFFAAQQTQYAADVRFRIRYRSDVLMTDRLVYDSVNYDIVQVSEIGRREGLELFATSAPA
jgi:SPP1 family predicted phage head-tail adaptor